MASRSTGNPRAIPAARRWSHCTAGRGAGCHPIAGACSIRAQIRCCADFTPDFSGELTSLQVEAGKLVARIYGEFHRATGQPRRSYASPHYGRAFAGRPELYRSDHRRARAEKRYARLQDIFGTLASPADVARARAVLEILCVDNLPIPAAYLPNAAVILDRVAAAFELFESA